MNIDNQNMKQVLRNFPQQVLEGIDIGKQALIPRIDFKNIIFCGMGGSAIGGDIMASIVNSLPILVSRSYDIPKWIDKQTLAFVVSYSGNTEETLAAYERLVETGANIIRITSGGQLAEKKYGVLVMIPATGLQPRCAIGYLFFSSYMILQRLGVVNDVLDEVISVIKTQAKTLEKEDSIAYNLASKLVNRLPIIYTSSPLESVARRWQAQFNENSKILAHINIFPELNHNEIVGFGSPAIDNLVIILRDICFNSRIKKRIDITKDIFSSFTSGIEEIYSEGDSLPTRLFSLIYIGDWTSYHLAMMRDIDPTPVERIMNLKERLKT